MFFFLPNVCVWTAVCCLPRTNKALAESLDQAVDPQDPLVNRLLRMMATTAMSQALYFSTGLQSQDQYYHYGMPNSTQIIHYCDMCQCSFLLCFWSINQDMMIKTLEVTSNFCQPALRVAGCWSLTHPSQGTLWTRHQFTG